MGNITTIRDDAQETVFFKNTIVTPQNEYTYDALYRIIVAQGRESINSPNFSNNDNSSDSHAFVNAMAPWDGSKLALRLYSQRYTYER